MHWDSIKLFEDYEFLLKPMQISLTRPSDKDRPSGAAWGRLGPRGAEVSGVE